LLEITFRIMLMSGIKKNGVTIIEMQDVGLLK
jgi:hypothetical protein